MAIKKLFQIFFANSFVFCEFGKSTPTNFQYSFVAGVLADKAEGGRVGVRFLETLVMSGMPPRNGSADEFYRNEARVVVLFALPDVSKSNFSSLELGLREPH